MPCYGTEATETVQTSILKASRAFQIKISHKKLEEQTVKDFFTVQLDPLRCQIGISKVVVEKVVLTHFPSFCSFCNLSMKPAVMIPAGRAMIAMPKNAEIIVMTRPAVDTGYMSP